ncbi:protein kinase [Angomonas deanei]|nr:protein kinase [Angomonas deanei]|eukprot:EPY37889.1 protein kinase [Angomonas deanei]
MPYPGCERLVGKKIVCSDVIGTPRYGAPEMFYAKFTQTHYDGFTADTWSIGVVTYITLSGSFPYSAGSNATEKEVFRIIMDTPLPHPSDVSPLALDFIQSLLNKDPSKRIPLYNALNHPWLAEVIVPRGSVVAAKLLQENALSSPEIANACAQFNNEAQKLHLCIAKLQHEITVLRTERDQVLEEREGRGETREGRTPSRRAQTPSGLSRPRSTRSQASSLRSPHTATSTTKRSASRDVSSSEVTSSQRGSSLTARTRSPLARSAGGAAVRRGTPARTGGTTPTRTGGRSSSTHRGSATNRSSTPSGGTRSSTPGRSANRSRTPGAAGGGSSVNPANELHVGDHVTYKGYKAVVRFNGSTTFGAGVWIGLEMLEGNEGTNDGSSFIDKKQYFTCPKGKGVFVRASQIKKS